VALFIARYDLRAPASGAPAPDLYRAALEQATFCEQHGFDMLVLSEHHGVDDGYLSSPLVMAAAVAGRTQAIPIIISALLVPLHEPLRLAEDIAVLDLATGGRVQYVAGLGYRPEEYEAVGLSWDDRGARMDHCLETLKQAWTGDEFDYDGRRVRVTPTPASKPHPLFFYGGGTKAAARRAAKYDLPMFLQHEATDVIDAYQAEREKLGLGPGLAMAPSGPGTVFVAEDPDKAWAEIGPYLLYEAKVYSSWQQGVTSQVHDKSQTVEEMQAAGVYRIVTPDECVDLAAVQGPMGPITTHPLIGGMPPEISWPYLEALATVAQRVKGQSASS
jgi:alkanesulfonate monooxygenase SsuD/methylene tetrahydromethanopterin reductase-like flavin-dependent oxidoreductase (luciferase family)